jgi:TonB family protein
MKIVGIVLLVITTSSISYSQSNIDKAKKSFSERNFDKAAEYATAALKENPKNPDAMILAGDVFYEAGKLDSALFWYKSTEKMNAKNAAAVRKIGQVYTKQGNSQEAIKTIQRAVKLNEKDSYTYLALGEAFLKSPTPDQAEQPLLKAKELNKQLFQACVMLGEFYQTRGKADPARTNFEDALRIDANQLEIRKKLATVTLDDNERDPARDEPIAVDKEPYVDLSVLNRSVIYPQVAKRAGIEGKVAVRVLVRKDGKPKKNFIIESDSELLNKSAVDAVMQAKFLPAIQNGKPLACWITVPISFKLK